MVNDAAGWVHRQFGECALLVRDSVAPGEFENTRYVGLEHIEQGGLHLNGFGESADVSSLKSAFKAGDILFGKLRPYFRKVALASFDGVCSTDIWVVRSRDCVDQRFLFYWMASPAFVEVASRGSEGTKMPRAKWEYVSRVEGVLPPLPEQQAIASILGSLDDKIELNRRMNQTLEEIARALFKFWFVDFGPVRAKAEGRWKKGESLPGMPADMWDLWPSEFEESELGEIPKGWRVGSIYEVATVKYGAPYSSSLFSGPGTGRPLIRIRDLQTHSPEVDTTERHPRDVAVDGGDIVVGMDGEFRVHPWTGPKAVLNQRLCKFEPKEGVPKPFVSFTIEEHMAFFERSKVGTTVVHLGKADIDTIQVRIPTPTVLKAYGRLADSLLDLVVTNAASVRVLAETRDTLLPKLLSGEIRVPLDGGR